MAEASHPPPAELAERVARLLRDSIGVSMTVALRAPGDVPRSEGGKLARVVDARALA